MAGRGFRAHWIVALCVVFCITGRAWAESAGALVKKGNDAFKSGKYDNAMAAYEKASVEAPESPYVYFDKGTAQYAKGNFTEAATLFEQAGIKAKDERLEAMSAYNKGNCLFRESERQRDSDLRKSLEALEHAITQYQQALKLDPGYTNAAHNIEVSRLVMKQVLDELKKKEDEQKKSQQKQQEQANKLKDLIDRQEKLGAKTRDLQRQAPPDKNERARDLAREQDKLKSDTQKLADEQKNSQQNAPNHQQSKPAEHLKSAADEQSSAEKNMNDADLDNAGQHQDKAVEEMKEALKQMGDPSSGAGQKEEKKENPKQENKAQASKGQQKDKQAAPRDETAQNILQQEKEDREQNQPSTPGAYSPVDKDW